MVREKIRPGRVPRKREVGRRRGADAGFRANTGRKSARSGPSACTHVWTAPKVCLEKAGFNFLRPPPTLFAAPLRWSGNPSLA